MYRTPLIPLEIVFDLIDKIQKDFNIDEKRIYVLGASMGGFGSWTAMQEEPDLFAAGIPVCGGPSPTQNLDLDRIKHIPIWAFHGKEDSTIPYEKSKNAFEKLKIAKGNCKLTSLSGIKHSSWIQAFEYKGDDKAKGYVTEYSSNKCDKESDVWEWLFRQHK